MAKRRHAIVISDDDDDDVTNSFAPLPLPNIHSSKPPSSLSQLPGPRTKARRNDSDASKSLPNRVIGFAADLPDVECQFYPKDGQSWAIKYSPRKVSDLAVHSRKIAEVQEWFEDKLRNAKISCGNNVLVLTGPAGAGKTALVHVLVDLFDIELFEWDPPVPTLWKEYLHHINPDIPYVSKMDEFIGFLEKVRKYPLLPYSQVVHQEENRSVSLESISGASSKVLLIDDLPMPKEREAAGKLCRFFYQFAVSVRFPTIIIITEFLENKENGQRTNSITTDIVQALEDGGAKKITFNPITANAIRKTLNKILMAERCTVSNEALSFIAESCGGDIRHAIYCLQFLCIGRIPVSSAWDPGGARCSRDKPKRRKVSRDLNRNRMPGDCTVFPPIEQSLSVGCRDSVLALFHALGKVLYNKRLMDEANDTGERTIGSVIKHELQRRPLNMEVPEIILAQCHAEAASFVSFLHENFLEFVDDEGIDDVSLSLSYFSDVDYLLGQKIATKHTVLLNYDESDPTKIKEAAAGSIAARGMLFANVHPAKHRWQSIRAPVMRQVERLANEKKAELHTKSLVFASESSTVISNSVLSSEWAPYQKHLVKTQPSIYHPPDWRETAERDVDIFNHEISLVSSVDIARIRLETETPESDDEIEEW